MLGLLLAVIFVTGTWVLGAPLPVAVVTALGMLLRWYILWSVIGGLYGLYSAVRATDEADPGILNKLWMLGFSLILVGFVWTAHYGALIWGVHKLITIFTIGFNWIRLIGGFFLITIGCIMQTVEMRLLWDKLKSL